MKPLSRTRRPQQIDAALRGLIDGIAAARTTRQARRHLHAGDPGLPPAGADESLQSDRTGSSGAPSILDENPIGTPVRVNGPYPDAIPLSTMPPQVIEALPKLPEELEYRFIGDRLILFDHHAHLMVDYIDRALPRG